MSVATARGVVIRLPEDAGEWASITRLLRQIDALPETLA